MKNSVDILVDVCLGDTGKGKIVDHLVASGNYNMVARWHGGRNAGHTIYDENSIKHVVHHLPSGVLHSGIDLYMGSQMVLHPDSLLEEIEKENLDIRRLKIAYNAHIVLDEHIEEDKRENAHIGTTNKGIGPCYKAKVGRSGIRFIDWLNNSKESTVGRFKGLAVDVSEELNERIRCGERLLCEGAQGSMLDIDHGTYPYVTSSNCVAQSALVSLGLSPFYVGKIYGITKAYSTRVGNGPFVTEIKEKYIAERLTELGKEYGATTGRVRKVGWLDLKELKKQIELNSITDLVITKIDILQQLGEELNINIPFMENEVMSKELKPESLLPSNNGIVAMIEDYIPNDNFRVSMISFGPGRNDIKKLI